MKRILAALLVATVISGCGGKKDRRTLVMVPKGVHPYYEPCYEGFKDAAAKHGVAVEYRAPADFELPQQVKVLEDLIARQVDGIAVSAVDDDGLVRVIKDATGAGIKVITFDAPAPSSAALCYIGTLNEAAGRAAAKVMIGLLKGEGQVAVLQGGLSAPNLNQRFNGFKAELARSAPRIEIVAREDTQGKMDVTVNKVEALLEAHPRLKAIFGVSAYGAPGSAAVIEERKLSGKIVIGGFDDMPDTLSAIRKGTVSFCLAQKTYKMGWLSVEKLLAALDGKPVEKEIDTGLVVVRKDNVDTYMEDMKKEFE